MLDSYTSSCVWNHEVGAIIQESRLVWVVDNTPGVSITSELFALACGPTLTPISVNSCVVNGVRFVLHSRDKRRTTQNSGICSPGGKDGEMYYGQLQEIFEFSYLSFKVVLFRFKWFDTSNEGRKVNHLVLRNNMTQILTKGKAFKDDQYILATQVKQCFYLEDMARRQPHWKVVEHVNHKKFLDGGVIVVEEDPDVIHFDNSSDLPLSTSLNDLDNATLHIDGQSTEVDAPPDIIDLDEDDDIIDDEDALPHDLADSDDEDLVNVDDDDGVDVMSTDVARGYGGDGGSDDRPPTHYIPTGCGGCFANRGKGTRKPNLGGRKAGRLHTRQETRNLGLKKITDDKGPVPIRFEWDDKKTLMPLGDHASHWSNYLGELIREMPLYYPSWQKVPAERKAAILTKIGTQFDLTPHMQSQRWTDINAGIQQHLQKLYNTNKASLKAAHWVINPETGTYDVESIRQRRPQNITPADWDAQIAFWNDPRNQARAAQNRQNRAKSTVVCRQGSRSLARLRDQMEEMLRLQALGSNTEKGVPYTEEEIMAIVKMIMRLFKSDEKFSHMLDQFESSPEFGGASGSGGCEDDEPGDDEDDDEDEEDGDS
ncbi:retrotransposon protein, putative, ty3-gypsy subclass [Tanacetum coccineum]